MKPLAVDERDDDDDEDNGINIISPTPYLLQHCNIDLSATRNLERNNKNATSRISDVNIISKNYVWVIGFYTHFSIIRINTDTHRAKERSRKGMLINVYAILSNL